MGCGRHRILRLRILIRVAISNSRGRDIVVGCTGWVSDAIVDRVEDGASVGLTVVNCTIRIGTCWCGAHVEVRDAWCGRAGSEPGRYLGDGLAMVNAGVLLEKFLVFYRGARPAPPFHYGKDSHDDGKTANNSNDAESRTDSGLVIEKARGRTGASGSTRRNGRTGRKGAGLSGRIGDRIIDKRCRWIVENVGCGPDGRTSDTG